MIAHVWGDQLDAEATCQRCGLRYGDWADDDPGCDDVEVMDP